MPSQSVDDDLPEYLRPQVVSRIASFLLSRAKERRTAAAQEPIRARNMAPRKAQPPRTKAARAERTEPQHQGLPQDPLQFEGRQHESDQTRIRDDR